jgi:PKD repeat protein
MKNIYKGFFCFLFLVSLTARSQNAPVTTAGIVTSHLPTVTVPITVTNFIDISSISLTMDFNLSIVNVLSLVPNAALTDFTADWTSNPGRLVMSWYGEPGVTLDDYSHLVDITFSCVYSGETDLTWIDDGTSCEYAKYDGGDFTVLNDSPPGDYYHNGHITYQPNGPITIAGTVISPGPTVTVPITVIGFVDIGAISLTLDYDKNVVQVSSISVNAAFTNFTADWTSNPGRIMMSWYGEAGVTLDDYSHLLDITFTCLVPGETDLTWMDNGISCEYAKYDGGAFNVLYDSPTPDFYINGHITYQRAAPVTIAPIYTSAPDLPICIPIKVIGFTNIGTISLTMNYNPSVLTFTGFNSFNGPAGWDFDVQAATAGTMIVSGYGPGYSLPGTSILFNACFDYHGGTSLLEWYDANVTACEYADGTTLTPLYDIPQPAFYINGLVTAPLTAMFSADNVTPTRTTTVHFTDESTGGPTSWEWSFDRAVVYMNGTTFQSQHPDVKFPAGGPYTVTLTVHNAYLTDSEVKIAYIWAGIPGLWTGGTSDDWYTITNWDDWRVPDNSTDVLIPPEIVPGWTVPHWPYYIGDFIIGTQCNTITLGDITSQMTVTGDIIF